MDHIETIPRQSIRCAILGPVSTGKSTLINSLYQSKYSITKMKRTTMCPQIYQEYPNKEEWDINDDICKINDESNNSMENQSLGTYDTKFQTLIHKVPKIEDAIQACLPIDMYDIPGLDDGVKEVIYYKYLNDTISQLDVIIFMIDIKESLNTSGSRKILDLIIEGLHRNPEKQYKMIVTVNKCDDMVITTN